MSDAPGRAIFHVKDSQGEGYGAAVEREAALDEVEILEEEDDDDELNEDGEGEGRFGSEGDDDTNMHDVGNDGHDRDDNRPNGVHVVERHGEP